MHLVSGRSLKIILVNIFLTGRVTGYSGRVGLTSKKKKKKSSRVMGQPIFASGQKSSLGQVFFKSGQKILTHFAMSSNNVENI